MLKVEWKCRYASSWNSHYVYLQGLYRGLTVAQVAGQDMVLVLKVINVQAVNQIGNYVDGITKREKNINSVYAEKN